jgi:hypothetical protein
MKDNKTKKVVDWIKYKNLKEASINYSALKGLKRVNKILSRIIKFGLIGFLFYSGIQTCYLKYKQIMENEINDLENQLKRNPNLKKLYLQNHLKLSLDYVNRDDYVLSEDKADITYYREKLLKNATGLVLETCKKYI